MNMNDTIDLSGISADNVYRIRRSKKNGKLISHNEYGKIIIIKNWKSLQDMAKWFPLKTEKTAFSPR